MKYSVILFNYNGGARLESCLQAVTALRIPEGAEVERLLVDVDSGSGLARRLRQSEPGLRLLELPVRAGLTESLNQAARTASGDYLAFVHYHVLLHPSWLDATREALARAGEGPPPACACTLLEKDLAAGGLWEAGEPGPVRYVLHPPAGAYLVERQAFLDCGGFDGDYYLGEENVDLGMRLWQRGRAVVQVEGDLARVSGPGVYGHYGPAEQAFFRARNRLLTVLKNYEIEGVCRFLPLVLVALVRRAWREAGLDYQRYHIDRAARGFAGAEARIPPQAAAPLLALDDLLGQLDRVLYRRQRVQEARTVGDAEIYGRVAHPYETDRQLEAAAGDEALLERLRVLLDSLVAGQDGKRH